MLGQAARQVATSLRAVASVFANPQVRKLQIAWGASSFALWSFAIALLHDVARTASVRATTATTLLALDREHFLAAMTGHHRSHEAAASIAEERLSPLA